MISKMLSKIKSFLFENTSTKQTIMKNTFWLILAEGVNKGSVFVVTILIARILGPEEFGIMSFVTAFVSMFIVLTDFGLTTLMVREVSRDQSRLPEYLVNLSFLKVILGLITFMIVAIVSPWIGKPDSYLTLILIYAGYAIVNNLAEFLRAFFRPSEQMQHEAYLKIGNGLIFTLIMGYILLAHGTLESIMYGYFIIGVFSLVVTLLYLGIKFKFHKWKNLLKKDLINASYRIGFIFVLNAFFFQIYNISDQIMLGFYGLEFELGKYASAYQFSAVVTLIFSIMISSFSPQIVKNISHQNKFISLVSQFEKILFFSIFLVSVVLIISSKFIYNLILTKEFSDGYVSLNILAISLIFSIVNVYIGTVLQNIKKESLCLIAVFFGGILNIIMNFYFIQYGAIGVAITTLLANIIVFILLKIFFNHVKKSYWKNNQ